MTELNKNQSRSIDVDDIDDKLDCLHITGKSKISNGSRKDSNIANKQEIKDNRAESISVVDNAASNTTTIKNSNSKNTSGENQVERNDAKFEKSNGKQDVKEKEKNCRSSDSGDDDTIRLLSLLNEYEILANDTFRVNYTSGFLDLSRANYYGSSRFSVDSIDRRPRDATAKIEAVGEGKFHLVDLWENFQKITKAQKAAQAKEKPSGEKSKKTSVPEDSKVKDKAGSNSGKGTKKEESSIDTDKEAVTSARDSASGVRSRKQKASATSSKTGISDVDGEDGHEKTESNPPLDPIRQFGRMVPYQLRNAQSHFQGALRNSIELLALQQEILRLVETLQKAN